MVTHEFHPQRGGIAVYAAEMAQAATQLGYNVQVWAPSSPQPDPAWPFELRRLPMSGTHDVSSQWHIAREMIRRRRLLRQALLYVPEPGPIFALLLLQYIRATHPARLIITLHGSEIQHLGSRPFLRWTARRLFQRADRLSVANEFARRLLVENFSLPSDRIVVAPCALRSDFAKIPSPPPRALSAGRERVVILTVARLHPRKGQHHVLDALSRLPAELKARIEYRLVGDCRRPEYKSQLEQLAAQAGLPVTFHGAVADADLPRHYAEADIFAMTSSPHRHSVEGFGMVYLEAGAHGLPVVAFATGGVAEAVGDGDNGLLVPEQDTAKLTAAFARLITDPALRARLGANGRQRAQTRTWLDSARVLFG
jgi:glycosyltransferase involved in cell wall biosynthesis